MSWIQTFTLWAMLFSINVGLYRIIELLEKIA